MSSYSIELDKIYTQTLQAEWLQQHHVALDVLRIDEVHKVISGNKWFKLKYYLQDALSSNAGAAATFGGAYSNHIVAFAYACKEAGIKSIGIIRGEEPSIISDTLKDAKNAGMELHFVSRSVYNNRQTIKSQFDNAVYWIEEGGYGKHGAMGAAEILSFAQNKEKYSHIVCAVGTGTMMAGIIKSADIHQHVIGISSMKNNHTLTEQVKNLLEPHEQQKQFSIVNDFHFGGYAKHPPQLLQFMNESWQQLHLPTDIVYTAKTLFGIKQFILNNTIPSGSSVLMIHSGGLQGNRSLPVNTLLF